MPEREHDETLAEDARLIRFLVREDWIVSKGGQETVASFVFLDGRTHEVSCYLDSPQTRGSLRDKFPGMRVAVVTVRAARASGHIVARDEDGGAGIPGHVVLVQVEARLESKEHKRKTRELASTSTIEPL